MVCWLKHSCQSLALKLMKWKQYCSPLLLWADIFMLSSLPLVPKALYFFANEGWIDIIWLCKHINILNKLGIPDVHTHTQAQYEGQAACWSGLTEQFPPPPPTLSCVDFVRVGWMYNEDSTQVCTSEWRQWSFWSLFCPITSVPFIFLLFSFLHCVILLIDSWSTLQPKPVCIIKASICRRSYLLLLILFTR